MRSDICYLNGKEGRETVLNEVEKTAQYCGLNHKQQLQLRLLAEELTGMVEGRIGEYSAEFWIEREQSKYELRLVLNRKLSEADENSLLKTATTNRGQVPTGMMDRIGMFLDNIVKNQERKLEQIASSGVAVRGMGSMYAAATEGSEGIRWSLASYAKEVEKEKEPDKLEDLERSIIAKLADDIVVRIRGNKAEVIVEKTF